MAKIRQDWVDALRGVALTGVIVFHATQLTSNYRDVNPALQGINDALDGFRMPALIAISGILSAGIGRWDWPAVLRRRVGPLALIYGAWAVVLAVASTLLFGNGVNELRGVLLMPVVPVGELWYLYALAVYLAVGRASRSLSTPMIVALSLAVSLGVRLVWSDAAPAIGGWAWVLAHWMYFVCAQRFAAAYRSAAEGSSWVRAVAAIVVFALVAGVAVREGALTTVSALIPLSIAGTFVGLACAGAWGSAWLWGWARVVGRRSLGVYASHLLIMMVLLHLLGDAVGPFPADGVVMPLGIAAATLALAVLLQVALSRWAPVPLLRPWWSTAGAEQPRAPARAQ